MLSLPAFRQAVCNRDHPLFCLGIVAPAYWEEGTHGRKQGGLAAIVCQGEAGRVSPARRAAERHNGNTWGVWAW